MIYRVALTPDEEGDEYETLIDAIDAASILEHLTRKSWYVYDAFGNLVHPCTQVDYKRTYF
jgi:hypothetical protein